MTVAERRGAVLVDVLAAIGQRLGHDELEVLVMLAEGTLAGECIYGQLDLGRDRRDFRRESAEELLDGAFYIAADLARRGRDASWRRRGGGK